MDRVANSEGTEKMQSFTISGADLFAALSKVAHVVETLPFGKNGAARNARPIDSFAAIQTTRRYSIGAFALARRTFEEGKTNV